MKILVGVDDSSVSLSAIDLSIKHAKAFKATVVLVTSLVGGKDADAEEIGKSENMLAVAGKRVEEAGVPCETHLLIRDAAPGKDIVDYADQIQADQIIVGVLRKSRVGKLVFQSTAQYVILNASCPVVSIK